MTGLRRSVGAVLLLLLSACRGGVERMVEQVESGDSAAIGDSATDTVQQLGYPQSQRGHLVARGVGGYSVDGSWPARAGMCEDPAMLELVAAQPGVGTIILLLLPAAQDRITTYPVRPVERAVPSPPAARMGMQLIDGRSANFFQAVDGAVEVHTFGERVGGRYRVTLWELSSRGQVEYAGVFEGIRIERLPEERCLEVKEEFERSRAPATG